MSACNHRHRCSRLQRLLDDPRLVVYRPTTAPAGTGDHLDATDLVLKLKRRFKSRHKPIPISLQDQHNHRSTTRQKGGLRTPLTVRLVGAQPPPSRAVRPAIGIRKRHGAQILASCRRWLPGPGVASRSSEPLGSAPRPSKRWPSRVWSVRPADVYFGRGQTILLERERIKRQTIQRRRLNHRAIAA